MSPVILLVLHVPQIRWADLELVGEMIPSVIVGWLVEVRVQAVFAGSVRRMRSRRTAVVSVTWPVLSRALTFSLPPWMQWGLGASWPAPWVPPVARPPPFFPFSGRYVFHYQTLQTILSQDVIDVSHLSNSDIFLRISCLRHLLPLISLYLIVFLSMAF